eukprot:gene4673-13929_t
MDLVERDGLVSARDRRYRVTKNCNRYRRQLLLAIAREMECIQVDTLRLAIVSTGVEKLETEGATGKAESSSDVRRPMQYFICPGPDRKHPNFVNTDGAACYPRRIKLDFKGRCIHYFCVHSGGGGNIQWVARRILTIGSWVVTLTSFEAADKEKTAVATGLHGQVLDIDLKGAVIVHFLTIDRHIAIDKEDFHLLGPAVSWPGAGVLVKQPFTTAHPLDRAYDWDIPEGTRGRVDEIEDATGTAIVRFRGADTTVRVPPSRMHLLQPSIGSDAAVRVLKQYTILARGGAAIPGGTSGMGIRLLSNWDAEINFEDGYGKQVIREDDFHMMRVIDATHRENPSSTVTLDGYFGRLKEFLRRSKCPCEGPLLWPQVRLFQWHDGKNKTKLIMDIIKKENADKLWHATAPGEDATVIRPAHAAKLRAAPSTVYGALFAHHQAMVDEAAAQC